MFGKENRGEAGVTLVATNCELVGDIHFNDQLLINGIVKAEKEKFDVDHPMGLKVSLLISTLFILLYFVYPSSLTELVSKINVI